VILDDFGQSLDDRSDIVEFDHLVSSNPYYLPMARLEEKGILFNSPIIIVTSNLVFGGSLAVDSQPPPILDLFSFWRRFSFACNLTSTNGRVSYRQLKLVSDCVMPDYQVVPNPDQPDPCHYQNNLSRFLLCNRYPLKVQCVRTEEKFSSYFKGLGDLYVFRLEHHQSTILNRWYQKICSLNIDVQKNPGDIEVDLKVNDAPFYEGCHLDINFPTRPPKSIPRVQGVPLPEPLKVRVITKGEPRGARGKGETVR
jgi:hypothetical protein